ncbi:MAG: response regulator [Planctomycetota bacterium]
MLPNDGKYILYVDDEQTALKYFEQLFGRDFRIRTASSGEEAWEYIQAHADEVAVLLTDQRMGAVSGVDLMERVRTRFPEIIRILTTAFTSLDNAVRSVNDGGAFRYLSKPVDEATMINTLTRACEFHALAAERDRLLREKLSVLHRLVVMDRVRGLATAVTALDGRLRGAWAALVSYMEQSPVKQRIRVQMEEIVELNMLALAKNESKQMVQTVEMLIRDTVANSTGDVSDLDVGAVVCSIAETRRPELLEDDLDLVFRSEGACLAEGDEGMLRALVDLLVRRLADVQDQPSRIELAVSPREDSVAIDVKGSFRALNEDQIASLFAAAIPLKRWPIGLDMDLLSAFLIVHHFGGSMQIEAEPPSGPGFRLTIPTRTPQEIRERQTTTVNPEWFETVYDSLEAWEEEIIGN